MYEDLKAFCDWAMQAPEVADDREMETIERWLVGKEEAYFRGMMRWSVHHVKTIAAVLHRMEQAAQGQADLVTMHCANCGEYLDIFAIANSHPDRPSLCWECRNADEDDKLLWGMPDKPLTPTA